MTREEKITTSSSCILTILCVPFAILLSAEFISPWLPVQTNKTFEGSSEFAFFSSKNAGNSLKYPESFAIRSIFFRDLPQITTCRPDSRAAMQQVSNRAKFDAKQVTITLPFL